MMSKQSVLVSASVSCMDLSDLRAAVREVEESQVSFYPGEHEGDHRYSH